jgi:hypothetical protein
MVDFNQGLFNEMFKKKYELLQQHADMEREATAAQFGPGGQGDRNNLAHERVSSMQYGPGGQGDRNNTVQLAGQSMQYGPGGMGDRNNIAMESSRQAGATLQSAQARGLTMQADIAQPNMKLATQRDRLGLLKSSMDNSGVINTGVRQGNLERGTRNPELVSFGDQEDWQPGPSLANPLPSVLQQIYAEQMRPKDKPRQRWTGLFPPSDDKL